MSNISDWAATILETDEDILVPVKKLWKEYTTQDTGVSLEDFTRVLAQDERFEFMEGIDHDEGLEGMSEEERAEYEQDMEAEGFFSGPRVKLKTRDLTPDHIAKMIKKHTDRMMGALWAAYDIRPEDLDAKSEQELLDIIVQAKNFQLKAQETINPEESDKTEKEP